MPRHKYRVNLTEEERAGLHKLVTSGRTAARTLTRARILLKSAGGDNDQTIAKALDVGLATISRVRQRCVAEGVEAAITSRKPQRHYQCKLDGSQEAHLIALACGEPPQGHARWTLRLLADRMVQLGYVDSLSHETVRGTLEKTNSNRGGVRPGSSPRRPTVHL
jgi:transposase